MPEHPLPIYKEKLNFYVLCFHLPFVLFGALVFVLAAVREAKDSTVVVYTIIYSAVVLILSIILIVRAVKGQDLYTKELEKRQSNLQALCDDLNITVYNNYQISAKSGNLGAWIELHFLNLSNKMVSSSKVQQLNQVENPNPFGSGTQVTDGFYHSMAKPVDKEM